MSNLKRKLTIDQFTAPVAVSDVSIMMASTYVGLEMLASFSQRDFAVFASLAHFLRPADWCARMQSMWRSLQLCCFGDKLPIKMDQA